MTERVLTLADGGIAVEPVLQRAEGRARIAFRRDGAVVRLFEFHQQGCCKIRLPRVERGREPEAVLLNTAGGITGGDRLVYEVEIGSGAVAAVTTQAAERIYRRSAGAAPGRVENRITLGAGAHVDWLPQETILFDRCGLTRSLEVDLDADATGLFVEMFVFGRAAMGEDVRTLSLSDRWRIRRDGRPIFADGLVVEGDAKAILARGATGGGGVAVATLVLADPAAAGRLEAVRGGLESCRGEVAASQWGELLSVRFLAASGQLLRQDVASVIEAMRGRPMPRVWYC